MTTTYKVNDTFLVIPDKNEINNVRLEPRIMKLLLYMIEHRGRMISRDEIITNVWEGYPGGDEGMNQAVSYLRKIFNDQGRKLIETIPKSGYVFNGSVQPIFAVENASFLAEEKHLPLTSEQGKKKTPSYLKYAFFAIVALVIIVWLFKPAIVSVAPNAPEGDAQISGPKQAPKAP